MRTYYQKTLPNDPTKDYYYIMRDTNKLQTIITEYGFLDNPNDIKKLENNWEKYAEAVIKAVAEYMGYPYKLSEESKTLYVVRPGDSLWSIANRFGTTVDELKRLNRLTNNNLSVGQELIISGEGPIVTPPSSGETYTVKAGDTLYTIAKNHNTTVENIKSKNNLVSNNLSVGQKLIISGEGPIVTPPSSEEIYIVKAGDSLYSIARKFNMSVDELKRLNNLSNNNLFIGQKLTTISSNQGQPETIAKRYTVKAGDSLWSIANKYEISVDTIKRLNNLSSNNLSIGQELILPEDITSPNIPNSDNTYIVQVGDTLWSIAQKNKITVEDIKRMNNLSNNSLLIGQKLIISNNGTNESVPVQTTHTVQVGDTLWSIANRFGTTVNAIKALNNLSNNNLSIGQQIKIPGL